MADSKKLSMADRILNEGALQGQKKAKEAKTLAEAKAKAWADNIVENFNKKKSLEQAAQLKENRKNNLLKKIDSCDWQDSKQVSKLINDYLDFSKKNVDDSWRLPTDLFESFRWLLDRASSIEAKSATKLIRIYNIWNDCFFDGANYDSIDPYDYINKFEMDEELAFRLIMVWKYEELKNLWVDQQILENANKKAFNNFKKLLKNKIDEIESSLEMYGFWDSEVAELLWPIISTATWNVRAFIYDNFSECWELDKDILCTLLDRDYDIYEDDYIYFKWIKKEDFINTLDEYQGTDDEEDEIDYLE